MSDEPKRELLPGEAEADAWIDTLEQRADAMSDDIVERLREDARGVAFHELSEEAADEIERLREAIVMAANRLDIALASDADIPVCKHCVDVALSYLRPCGQ